jgi:hypothetical protein
VAFHDDRDVRVAEAFGQERGVSVVSRLTGAHACLAE